MASILIIDDEETVREMISTMLRHAEYEVQDAADGVHGAGRLLICWRN